LRRRKWKKSPWWRWLVRFPARMNFLSHVIRAMVRTMTWNLDISTTRRLTPVFYSKTYIGLIGRSGINLGPDNESNGPVWWSRTRTVQSERADHVTRRTDRTRDPNRGQRVA
jgi:hypothetical protein